MGRISVLVWEFVSLGKMRLLSIFIGMFFLSILCYEVVAPSTEAGELSLFYAMFWVLLIAYIGGLIQCRDAPSQPWTFEKRLFLLPVSTPILVALKMWIPMLAAAMLYAATAVAMQLSTGYEWPIWGPAAVFTTAMAWALAIGWSLSSAPILRMVAGLLSVGVLLAWLSRRFGAGLVGGPAHPWQLGQADIVTMAAATVAAIVLAMLGVSKDRQGEAWNTGRFSAVLAATFLPALFKRSGTVRTFASPTSAQLWLEWRLKGWIMPVNLAVGLSVVAVGGALSGGGTAAILKSLVPFLVFVLALCPPAVGLLMGKMNLFDHETGLGTFRATRPLSDSQLAGVLLKVGAASLLCSWLVAVSVLGVMLAALHRWGDAQQVEKVWTTLTASVEPLDTTARVGALLLFLLISWMHMGMVTAVFLTGRNWLTCVLVEIPYGLAVAYFMLRELLPSGLAGALMQVVPWILGGLGLGVPVVAFLAARRLRLIGPTAPWIALAGWLISAAGIALHQWDWVTKTLSSGLTLERAFILMGLGALALATAPPALAPLAIGWNRHR